MDKIKSNPLKYIKIFSLVYLGLIVIFEILHYIMIAFILKFKQQSLFRLFIGYIPFLIFTVYIFKFYNKNKSHILLTLTYGISVLFALKTLISDISNLKYMFYWKTFQEWLYYGCIEQIIQTVFWAIILSITIFNMVNCIVKFKFLRTSQTLTTIQAILAVALILVTIIIHIATGKSITIITITQWVMAFIRLISMFVYVLFWKFGVNATSTTPIENALYKIKRQLDEGVINIDEYNFKKMEILNKL